MKKTLATIAVLALTSGAFAGFSATSTNSVSWPTTQTGEVYNDSISAPALLSVDSVSIDINHTWAGDVEIFLMSPGGSVWTLTQGATAGFGSSDDLAGEYTFVQSGGDTYNAQVTGALGNPIPAGTYNAEAWMDGPFDAGDWTLLVNDTAGGDAGTINSWTLNGTVPAPGAIALLGLAGLTSRRRRG